MSRHDERIEQHLREVEIRLEHMERELLELRLGQREIIHLLRTPRFTLSILWRDDSCKRPYHQIWRSDMAAIQAGQSGSFLLSASASDNSTPVITNPKLVADDSNVSVSPDASDPSGLTFTVTVPASDTQTSFNLSATADVTSNTSQTPQSVSASLGVTISPAAQPVTFTLTISEK